MKLFLSSDYGPKEANERKKIVSDHMMWKMKEKKTVRKKYSHFQGGSLIILDSPQRVEKRSASGMISITASYNSSSALPGMDL